MESFIEFLYSRFLLSNGVSIDTRTIEKDNLFFAISGPNFNANKFAKDALDKGAAYAVVDDESYKTDERIVLADDCLKALQDLALFHRKRFKKPVIGITGSNGKTTTKELINKVLSEKYIVHATAGNYNNHIGVPLTLLHIHPQVEIAIIEMGANHVGEIEQLSSFSLPTHGMITNIGQAHTETFGGVEGVIMGKSELFDFLRKNNGKAFINMNDKVLSNMSKRFSDPVLFPTEDISLVDFNPYLEIEVSGHKCKTQLTGKYNLANISAAIAVGREFGVPEQKIREA
ncbi:MAG: UDP-N-acetylmuramoyl-tripeptide--D-alanyl-D-alanine ligase, partial [Ekhidna sp.]